MTMTKFLAACILVTLGAPTLAQEDAPPRRPLRDVKGTVSLVPGLEGDVDAARVSCWLLDMRRQTIDPLCDGVTDAEGRFAFASVPWLEGHAWGFHSVVALCRLSDQAVGTAVLRGDGVDLSAVAIELRRAVTLRGVVRDHREQRLGGARVWVEMIGGTEGVWLTTAMPFWEARTDARGQFELTGLPAGRSVGLRVIHPECAEDRAQVKDPGEPCEIDLLPGAAIAGRVRYADGAPGERVWVAAQALGGGGGVGFRRIQADEDGNYRLESLRPGEFNVWAEAHDWTVAALPAVAATEDGTTVDDLVLVRGGFVTGRVIDVSTGKPVQPGAQADVAMYGPARPRNGGGGCECTPVLPDGTFRMRAPPGRNYVYLRCAGGGWSEASSGVEVDVAEGKETVVEFKAGQIRKR